MGHLSDRVFDALVDRLAELKTVEVSGPLVRISSFHVQLSPAEERLKGALCKTIRDAGPSTFDTTPRPTRHTNPPKPTPRPWPARKAGACHTGQL